ncbi:MAG: hypothetical protein ACJAZD_000947 [Ilumatobacter sp.]|jgi:hypothetical protein
MSWIGSSLKLAAPGEAVGVGDLVNRFDPAALPKDIAVAPDFVLRPEA